jgi:hypothetical protein
LPAQTDGPPTIRLALTAVLVGDVGSLVRVHLMRVTRGGIEPGVFRLMLQLPVL